MAILLKTAGWNIQRASASTVVREFVRKRLGVGKSDGNYGDQSISVAAIRSLFQIVLYFHQKPRSPINFMTNLAAA
jgi:hypothetical protein